jgi:hypothetical protein
MDGDGSGAWTRSNTKGAVESRSSIDVRIWQRGELLYPGNSFSWSIEEPNFCGYKSCQMGFRSRRNKHAPGEKYCSW